MFISNSYDNTQENIFDSTQELQGSNFIDDPTLVSVEDGKKSYSLDETIQKVKEFNREGGRTALFIGKQADEALPEEEGTLWVSADKKLAYRPFSRERVHLLINFNKTENCKQIKQLFDFVVIDLETIKFFRGDFIERFSHFLKPTQTSQILFEAAPAISSLGLDSINNEKSYSVLYYPRELYFQEVGEDNEIYEQYLNDVGKDFLCLKEENHPDYQAFIEDKVFGGVFEDDEQDMCKANFQQFIINKIRKEKNILPLTSRLLREAQEQTYEHMKNFYNDVKFIKDVKWPYEKPVEVGLRSYYIAKSPKQISAQ